MIALIGVATRHQSEAIKDVYKYARQALHGVYQDDFGIVLDENSLEKIIEKLKNFRILIAMVLTGGTRRLITRLGELGNILILISNTKQNALASALHALYVLSRANKRIWHIHGDVHELPWNTIRKVILGTKRLISLTPGKIVLIGVPEEYLSEEGYEVKNLNEKFGLTVETIPLKAFLKKLENAKPNREILRRISDMPKEAKVGANADETIAKMYSVAMELCEGAVAGGIRCFPIILRTDATPCLIVSDLLDKGKIFGCEADLAAIVTMLLAREITGEFPFMANPITINEENKLILAHCTAASKLFESVAKLVSHFETGKGYAVQGDFKENTVVTILKVDPSFTKMFLARGRIVRGKKFSEEFCRNQVVVEIERKPISIFSGEFAHHIVMIYGDHISELSHVARLFGLGVVYE